MIKFITAKVGDFIVLVNKRRSRTTHLDSAFMKLVLFAIRLNNDNHYGADKIIIIILKLSRNENI